METILVGRITHLRFGIDGTALFRINGGAVTCVALPPWSLQICERRGYPGHEVRVAGLYRQGARKKELAITALTLVD